MPGIGRALLSGNPPNPNGRFEGAFVAPSMASGSMPSRAQRICPRPAGEAFGGSTTINAKAAAAAASAAFPPLRNIFKPTSVACGDPLAMAPMRPSASTYRASINQARACSGSPLSSQAVRPPHPRRLDRRSATLTPLLHVQGGKPFDVRPDHFAVLAGHPDKPWSQQNSADERHNLEGD